MRGGQGTLLPAKGKRLSRIKSLMVAVFAAGSAAAVAQTYITPTTPGWTFSEETPIASGAFVMGPGLAPSGSPGSYQITVEQPGGGLFYTQQYAGTPLTRLSGPIGTDGAAGPVHTFNFAPQVPVAIAVPTLGNLGLLVLVAQIAAGGIAAVRRRA